MASSPDKVADFLSFLKSINPQLCRYPRDFDREAYLEQARRLASELRFQTAQLFHLDASIQDATHSAEIPIPLALLHDTSIVRPALRLSNHAALVTITCERKLDPAWLTRIQSALERCGYTFVPEFCSASRLTLGIGLMATYSISYSITYEHARHRRRLLILNRVRPLHAHG